MKRVLFFVAVLSIIFSIFIVSASAAEQPAFILNETFHIARLDINSSNGWYAYYSYSEEFPFSDSFASQASAMQPVVLDSKTFVHFDFNISRSDGRPLAYAGNDVYFSLSEIYARHWTSYNDTWYEWENAIVASITIYYSDGSNSIFNSGYNFVFNDLTHEFSANISLSNSDKDIDSITFAFQYWPYNYDGLYSPSTYFQVEWFTYHFPRFNVYSSSLGSLVGSGGSGGAPGSYDSVLGGTSDGLSEANASLSITLDLLKNYQGSLLAVSWILDQVISKPFFSDLVYISGGIGIITLIFGVSLTVSRSISHSNKNHRNGGD